MAKYKIEIDREECTGDGICVDEAPNVFELDDEDIAIVTNPAGDPDDAILEAAEACPTEAIILTDIASGKKVWPED